MNGKHVFPSTLRSVDILHCSDSSMRLYHQDAHAARTKPPFSEPAYDITSLIENPPFLQSQFPFIIHSENGQATDLTTCTNNVKLKTENDGGPTQKISLEASFMKNNEAWMNDHVVPAEKKALQFRSAEDTIVDDHCSCLPSLCQHFADKYSSSNKTEYIPNSMAFLPSEQGESSRKDEKILSIKEKEHIKNNFPSSGVSTDQYISNATILNAAYQLLTISDLNSSEVENSHLRYQNDEGISLNELGINHIDDHASIENGNLHYVQNTTLLNIAIQLLTVSEGQSSQVETSQFIDEKEIGTLSSGCEYKQLQTDISCISNKHLTISEDKYTEILNPDIMRPLPMKEISVKYRQYYKQISPQDYDFAMNIMAYIEVLNDGAWHATVTHFNKNVKNMVKYLWNEIKNTANNNILLERFYRDDFLNAMEYFTEFAFQKKYNVSEFIQYCILMCQLGVLARNRNFKEAPLHVIDYLQKGISKIEHEESIIFEIDVKKYARELSELM